LDGRYQEDLSDYLKTGFKATVVRTKLDLLGVEWLGRVLDRKFYDDILKLGNVDACGEGGEYHTVITDGPMFKNKIEIKKHRNISLKAALDTWKSRNSKLCPSKGN